MFTTNKLALLIYSRGTHSDLHFTLQFFCGPKKDPTNIDSRERRYRGSPVKFFNFYGEKIFVSLFIEEHYGSITITKEHIYKSLKLK